MPNMTVMAPKNKPELMAMLAFAVKHNGPVAVRYPRGAASRVLRGIENEIELGKAEIISRGEKIALVSFGTMMDKAYAVYERLAAENFSPTLINARFAKPIDLDMVASLANYEHVYVMEDAAKIGGFGAKILEAANEIGIELKNLKRFAFPDAFLPQGEAEEIFHKYGLDVENMAAEILNEVRG